ncbi:PEP-CTERM sorting domain-containing protein [Roseobacter sp.]|uniref:PEP-CTERM sorting domain-containing protein n=1 Tax=Roseobacter sp. TaxID=1907202 RepID=UPI003857FB55
MMVKRFLAVTATAITMAGAAIAAPVSFTLDAFVTSNFNASTGLQETNFVDPDNPAGTLSLSYDTDDVFFSFVFFDGLNLNPTSFDLSLTLGGVSQTWSQPEFLFAFAIADEATGTELEEAGFFLATSDASASLADPNIIGIAPDLFSFGGEFMRFDEFGAAVGINLEISSIEPLDDLPTPVPVPGSLPLLLTGAFAVVALRRRNKKS